MERLDPQSVLARYRSATALPPETGDVLWQGLPRRAVETDAVEIEVQMPKVPGRWRSIGVGVAIVAGAIGLGSAFGVRRPAEDGLTAVVGRSLQGRAIGIAIDPPQRGTPVAAPAIAEKSVVDPFPSRLAPAAVPRTGRTGSAERGRRPRVPAAVRADAEPGRAPVDPVTDVEEEARLLGLARRALSSDAPQDAARWLAEHARRFPNGSLVEAREIGHVMVICALEGRSAADRAKRAFRGRHPGSPLASRLAEICTATHELDGSTGPP